MQALRTKLDGVLLLKAKVFHDDRGFFYESYNKRTLAGCGITAGFVQDNHSRSRTIPTWRLNGRTVEKRNYRQKTFRESGFAMLKFTTTLLRFLDEHI